VIRAAGPGQASLADRRSGDGARTMTRCGLDLRLQAKALVLALEPDLAPLDAAAALSAAAGTREVGAIATRRALRRILLVHANRPTERTARAVEALQLAAGRLGPGGSPAGRS